MKKMMLAFQFLTTLPFGSSQKVADEEIGGSSAWFVPVGFLQGVLLVLADYLLTTIFHPDLVIALVILILVLSNGGFHLDGLADTFDGLAIKSNGETEADRERRLTVMKEGTTGPAGAAAIVFALALKYLAIKNISNFPYFTYYSSLLFMPMASKWTVVACMFQGNPARLNGLGAVFIRGTGGKEMIISTMIFFFMLLLVPLSFGKYAPDDSLFLFSLAALFFLYLLSRIWVIISERKFGGLTGDILGALSEFAEIIFLFMVITWSRLFT